MTEKIQVYDVQSRQTCFVRCCLRMFRTGIMDKFLDVAKENNLDEDLPDDKPELELVNATDDPAELVNLCRKLKTPRGNDALTEKILADQERTMPVLIEKFYRNTFDHFIDNAVLIFAYCDEKYVDEVLKNYNNIRSELAKCEFCVVLGFRKRTDCVDFLKQELKNLGHDKNYKTGPEVALEELI